jgi:hypothetical protein
MTKSFYSCGFFLAKDFEKGYDKSFRMALKKISRLFLTDGESIFYFLWFASCFIQSNCERKNTHQLSNRTIVVAVSGFHKSHTF